MVRENDHSPEGVLRGFQERIALLERAINRASRAGFVLGEVRAYAGSVAPQGWGIANGDLYDREEYADLFALVGTTYGAGDGSTTFRIPDYRGRVLVGLDASQGEFDTLGEGGGEKTHVLTIAEMPSHSHGFLLPGAGSAGSLQGAMTGNSVPANPASGYAGVAPMGGGGAHNNLPPYRVVNYILRVI